MPYNYEVISWKNKLTIVQKNNDGKEILMKSIITYIL